MMNRKKLALTLLLLLGGSSPTLIPAAEKPSPKLNVLYSANRSGEIEPCGCQVNQLGGMDRLRSYLTRNAPELSEKTTLFVDSGDSFFSMVQLNERRRPQEMIRASLIAQADKLVGLDAFTPGERDFAGGLEFLRELEKSSGATFIASNLFGKDGQPIFETAKIFERAGVKVGVLALADPEALAVVPDLTVTPFLPVAEKTIRALKKDGANVIVVLSHLGLEKDRELAKLEGIDLIIGSHSLDSITTPVNVGKTWIVQPLNQGQQIGRVEFTGAEKKHFITDLDKSFNEDNEVTKLINQYREQVRKLAVADSGKETAVSSATPYVAHAFACRTCHQKQYEFWSKTKHSAAYLALYSKNQHFDPECISCHSIGYATEGGFADIIRPIILNAAYEKSIAPKGKKKPGLPFVETLMKKVFGNEIKKGAISSSNALGVSHFEKLHKRYDAEIRKLEEKEAIAKLYIGVQCEHCHGNRNGHPDPKVATLKKVSDETCLNCHAPPNATAFTAETLAIAKPKIACPLSSTH